MGIYIRLFVSRDVSDEEWAPVYEESLALAESFRLMDEEETEAFGEKLLSGVPVREREEGGARFWSAVGSRDTMGRGERAALFRSLGSSDGARGEDPLLFAARSAQLRDRETDEGCRILWNLDTGGEAYHIYLLAIGCVIEERLHGRACVDGDITLGQCRRAVRLAGERLGRTVGLPARCDLKALYRRVRAMSLGRPEVLGVFQGLYLGELDHEYGNFVGTHFTEGEIAGFWRREFERLRVGTRAFSAAIKRYFNTVGGLERLCILVSPGLGPEGAECFIRELMRAGLSKRVKDLRDCLEVSRTEEGPYTVYRQIAGLLFAEAANPQADAYIPREDLAEVLCRYFGNRCDVRKVMERWESARAGRDGECPWTALSDSMEAARYSVERDMESFDICDVRDLLYYEDGDRIAPETETICAGYLEFYESICGEAGFEKLMGEAAEARCAYLIRNSGGMFLMRRRWMEIFGGLFRDPDSFRRYYPMTRVVLDESSVWIVYAYVANDQFYRRFCSVRRTGDG